MGANFARDLGECAGEAEQASTEVAQEGPLNAVFVADLGALDGREGVCHPQERYAHAVEKGVGDDACRVAERPQAEFL